MPYTSQHKEKSRQRILASAYKLFNAKGYDNVSINEIMNDAGMTRGAFYAHFESKGQLYHDSIVFAAQHSDMTREKPDGLDAKSWINEMLRKYLNRKNLASFCSCPLASLASDVVVREAQVRKAYTRSFKELNDMIARYAEAVSRAGNETVLATSAMVVGGLAIARALDDTDLAERLLKSCQDKALSLLNDTEQAPDSV